MRELTCDEKISDLADSDSTVLFDPARTTPEIVHAAETPESSDLPAATEVEEHLTSLSHSILETSLGRKPQTFGHFVSSVRTTECFTDLGKLNLTMVVRANFNCCPSCLKK
jgi:hypothetical protein